MVAWSLYPYNAFQVHKWVPEIVVKTAKILGVSEEVTFDRGVGVGSDHVNVPTVIFRISPVLL